jgi:glycosyltransferase involved in cell wall biosynthesis
MHIAVVGPDPRFGGGAEAHTAALVDALRHLGHEVESLFVPHPGLRGRGISVERVEAIRILRGSSPLAPRIREADSCWVAGPLVTHGYAAAISGRPYDCWAGTTITDENRGRRIGLPIPRRLAQSANEPLLRRVERRVLRAARRLYATSAASRLAIARASSRDVDVLPLPVDGNRFTAVPDEQWAAQLSRPVLAVVGRADDPRRNVRLALDAFQLVRAQLPAARLRVIGRARDRWDAEGVEWLGEVTSVAEHLRGATLLLLPSRQEGFGIAAAEALACGVPVVSTPSGGPEELLRKSGGGVVVGGWSPEEMAGCATRLISDVARLTEMRRKGRAYVLREHSPVRLRELVAQALAD